MKEPFIGEFLENNYSTHILNGKKKNLRDHILDNI